MLARQTTDFVAYFFRAYPARSALMVVLLILSGLAEGIGIATLLPVLELAVSGEGEEASALSEAVATVLGVIGLSPTLGTLLLVIVAAMALKGVFRWLAMRQVGYAVAQIATDLRLRLIRALMRARWSYFSSQPVGYFANAISSEAHRASNAYKQACTAMAGAIQVVIYLALVVLISWQVALLAVAVGAAVLVILRGFVGMARQAGSDQKEVMKSLVSRLTEALPGIKPVKAMGREEHLLPLLEEETEGFNRAERDRVFATESLKAFQEPLLVLFLAAGLFVALTWGAEPFTAVVVLAFLFHRVVNRVNELQTQYQEITLGESHFWSIRSLVEEAENAVEEVGVTGSPPSLERGIRFEGVTFTYPGGQPVLEDVDLHIPAGGFVAITGPSGSGKTTLADLVIGLHRPDRGEVFIDDLPLGDVDLTSWRRSIGYVPQEVLLFNGSVYRNVTLGSTDFSREDVQRALEAAGAWSFVERLPHGMEQSIGEMGTKLSGGQRQRIAIARAMLGRPQLLILDEATTALDPVTEQAIARTLRDLQGAVTILAISHQTAMRDAADVVYEIQGGTVRGAETPPVLSARSLRPGVGE